MGEHFNENYSESEKYPKATFKGTLTDWSNESKTGTYILNGEIEFHGVTKSLENVKVSVKPSGNNLEIQGGFILFPKAFNIEIPSIVANKIANEVKVNFKCLLQPKSP